MQLTQLQRTANQCEVGQSSWVELCRRRTLRRRNSTQLDVELSWVGLCRYKRALRDITRISCVVTTMKLSHALQIYSTVFVKKCMWLHFSRVLQQQTIGEVRIQLCVCWQIIYACNSERFIKIGQHLPTLCSNYLKKDLGWISENVHLVMTDGIYCLNVVLHVV